MPQFGQIASLINYGAQIGERSRNASESSGSRVLHFKPATSLPRLTSATGGEGMDKKKGTERSVNSASTAPATPVHLTRSFPSKASSAPSLPTTIPIPPGAPLSEADCSAQPPSLLLPNATNSKKMHTQHHPPSSATSSSSAQCVLPHNIITSNQQQKPGSREAIIARNERGSPAVVRMSEASEKPDDSREDQPPTMAPATPKNIKEGFLVERHLKNATQELKDRQKYVEKLTVKMEANERKRVLIMHELSIMVAKSPQLKQREWELQRVLAMVNCSQKKDQVALDVQGKEINALQSMLRTLVLKVEAWRKVQRDRRNKIAEKEKEKSRAKFQKEMPDMPRWRTSQRLSTSDMMEFLQQAGLRGRPDRDLDWNDLLNEEIADMLSYSPRTAISLTLIRCCGSKEKAMDHMDCNRSGKLSATELKGGLECLKIPWVTILQDAGIPRPSNPSSLFRLFDTDETGDLDIAELFGKYEASNASEADEDLNRCSTPEAWTKWCLKSESGRQKGRRPNWYIDRAKLDEVLRNRATMDAIESRKEWMKVTMQRLKAHGVSGTVCRELVARHLPRGKGPKDVHGVHLLDSKTVQLERKMYIEKVNQPVKKIQTIVRDMIAQRRELSQARADLYYITERHAALAQKEEMKKASVIGMDLGFGAKVEKDEKAKDSRTKLEAAAPVPVGGDAFHSDPAVLAAIQDLRIDTNVADKCLKQFRKYDVDQSDMMEKKEFMRFLRETDTDGALAESDYDSSWRQVVNYRPKTARRNTVQKGHEAIHKAVSQDAKDQNKITFVQFLSWYASKHPTQGSPAETSAAPAP